MLILVYVLMFLTSFVLTYFVKSTSIKYGIYEKPNDRRMKQTPTVRIGGISFVLTFLIFLPYSSFVITTSFIWMIIGLWIVFIGGLIDDIYEISPITKTLFDLAGAIVVVMLGHLNINLVILPFGIYLNIPQGLNIILPIFWIISVINIMNLIDGLDGLSSGISIIVLTTISIVSWLQNDLVMSGLSFSFVVSLLGFIPWNWYPSKIIMGDCGARSIGYILSCIALIGFKNITFMSIVIPFLLLTIPILDTFIAIVRRRRENKSFSEPDKNHIHHKLVRHFKGSVVKSVFSLYSITLMFSFSSIVYTFKKNLGIILFILSITITLYVFNKLELIGKNKEK